MTGRVQGFESNKKNFDLLLLSKKNDKPFNSTKILKNLHLKFLYDEVYDANKQNLGWLMRESQPTGSIDREV